MVHRKEQNMSYWLNLIAANDNAPHDPRDYEDFDPAELMPDEVYEDDTPLDVVSFMTRYA
jgi:hypothetical protein